MTTATTQKKGRDKSAWGKAAVHTITLPSGFVVDVKIPNMPLLIKTGQIPNHLIDAAIGAIEADKITREMVEQQSEFFDKLVSVTVVDPAIDEEDVHDLPFEDIDLIVALATRDREVDAIGHQLGGLHKSAEWRTFRGIEHLYEDVEAASGE